MASVKKFSLQNPSSLLGCGGLHILKINRVLFYNGTMDLQRYGLLCPAWVSCRKASMSGLLNCWLSSASLAARALQEKEKH